MTIRVNEHLNSIKARVSSSTDDFMNECTFQQSIFGCERPHGERNETAFGNHWCSQLGLMSFIVKAWPVHGRSSGIWLWVRVGRGLHPSGEWYLYSHCEASSEGGSKAAENRATQYLSSVGIAPPATGSAVQQVQDMLPSGGIGDARQSALCPPEMVAGQLRVRQRRWRHVTISETLCKNSLRKDLPK